MPVSVKIHFSSKMAMIFMALTLANLPHTAIAGDALAINPDGTAQFLGTASGPNLLATRTPLAISGAITLDATAAGRLYVISGTTADYTITLPSATGVPGAIIGFTVVPFGNGAGQANRQFTIKPSGAETLDGRIAGLVLLHTNFLTVMSDGTRWISMIKKVDTDWQDGGVNVVTGSTTVPIKGTTARDIVWWRRRGDSMEARVEYRQTAAGSGSVLLYFWQVPFGCTIDTTKVAFDAAPSNGRALSSIGVSSVYGGAYVGKGVVAVYDATRVYANIIYHNGSGGSGSAATSGGVGAFTDPNAQWSMSYTVPIVNW